MNRRIYLFLVFQLFFSTLNAETWLVNKDHSFISFSATYLQDSLVKGQFKRFDGKVELDSTRWISAQLSIEASSIDTNNMLRDNHLRSKDFFAAGQFPRIHFVSSAIEHLGGDSYLVSGFIELLGEKIPLKVKSEQRILPDDRWGRANRVIALRVVLSRKKINLSWSALTAAGIELIGDDITIEAQFQLQPKGEGTPTSKFMIPVAQPIRRDGESKKYSPAMAQKGSPVNTSQQLATQQVSRQVNYFAITILLLVGIVGFSITTFVFKQWLQKKYVTYHELGLLGIASDLFMLAALSLYLWSVWVIGINF